MIEWPHTPLGVYPLLCFLHMFTNFLFFDCFWSPGLFSVSQINNKGLVNQHPELTLPWRFQRCFFLFLTNTFEAVLILNPQWISLLLTILNSFRQTFGHNSLSGDNATTAPTWQQRHNLPGGDATTTPSWQRRHNLSGSNATTRPTSPTWQLRHNLSGSNANAMDENMDVWELQN